MKNRKTERSFPLNSKNKAVKESELSSKNYLIGLGIILLISFIVYLPVFQNDFVNWDDDQYILENSLIQSFNLKEIFTTNVMGNYHPLTMLVYAIEYKLFGLHATGYHAINLFLHLFNTILSCSVVYLISRKYEIALIAALFFGIHPLHVESVAWASELKDLLYTFFFLLSFYFYLKYIKQNSKSHYVFSLLIFIPALLSKAMAASLPVILILTDYFFNRKFNGRVILEKIPFFLLAVIFGIIAIQAQQETGAIAEKEVYPWTQRIVFASYGFINYILKIVFPFQLSAFYPYPVKSGMPLPFYYLLFPVLVLVLAGYIIYTLRNTKKLMFAFGFFAATVFLVLQLLPVGQAIMADRYAYLPSLGLFYLAGDVAWNLWNKRKRAMVTILVIVFSIFFMVRTWQRCEVWKSSMTLWNDVIKQYQNVALAYNSRGVLFDGAGQFEKALTDYTKAIELNVANDKAFNNRGNLLMKNNRFADAIKDYTQSIQLKPDFFGSYKNRGNAYTSIQKYDSAYIDYTRAISLEPLDAETFYYRGNLLKNMNKADEAVKDYSKAIELRPKYPEAFFNRALVFMNTKQNEQSYSDFTTAIQLNPGFVEAYMNRGNLLFGQNKISEAMSDYEAAIHLQPENPTIYYNRGNLLGSLKRYDDAIIDFTKAIQLKTDYALAYFGRGISNCNKGNKQEGCTDLLQAVKLGFPPANEAFNNICR